jgi:hypothetical protein
MNTGLLSELLQAPPGRELDTPRRRTAFHAGRYELPDAQ